MNDLISRQDAIDALNRFSLGETDAMKLYLRMNDYLKKLPPVQPKIILCKDCKHCADDRNGYEPTLACELTYCGVLPDDFCSWAEPREESNGRPD